MVKYLSSIYKAMDLTPAPYILDTMVLACNPTWGNKGRGQKFKVILVGEFEVNLRQVKYPVLGRKKSGAGHGGAQLESQHSGGKQVDL